MRQQITIEGYTPDEVLALPDDELEALIMTGEPLAFRAGSAEILGEFRIIDACLRVELAHIEGGGEGVLPTLWITALPHLNTTTAEAGLASSSNLKFLFARVWKRTQVPPLQSLRCEGLYSRTLRARAPVNRNRVDRLRDELR